jgi:hypothetical protein
MSPVLQQSGPSARTGRTVAQMFAACNSASYFSRNAGEIYSKLNSAGFRVYCAVLKEFAGFFIKFDEATMLLTQNVTEMALPADCTQIVHLAERTTSTEDWHPIYPAGDLSNVLLNQLLDSGVLSFTIGSPSPFTYFGPYLDDVEAEGSQVQKIRIAPLPAETHFVQLVYTAKWIQVVNDKSLLMLPDEGTYAMEALATASLLRLNSDALANDFEAEGMQHLSAFVSWLRQRQIQCTPVVKPFLAEYM